MSRLAAGGRIDPHFHSFEELVYVLAGAPRLVLGGIEVELAPDEAVAIAVGETHSWSGPCDEACSWIELRTPPARAAARTFAIEFEAGARRTRRRRPASA